jgi:predicted neuraminidase
MRRTRWALALLICMGLIGARAQSGGDGFIFEPLSSGKALPGTQRDSHASTLVELKGGDLFAAWFTGSREGATDVVIRGARFSHGVWSAPVELARADNAACWNPVLFHTADGRLWLYYKYGTRPSTWAGALKWSDDEGRTWSAEERLPEGILGPIKDKPLVLSDGTIVSGSSVENEKWTVWIERSADGGKTWTKFGPVTLPESIDVPYDGTKAVSAEAPGLGRSLDEVGQTNLYPPSKTTMGIIQPTIVQLGGRHLRFYARSQSRAARIAAADSFDAGKTWTQPHFIDLPNPNSGIDAVRLQDGRIVLVFNNSYDQRTPLNLALSRDGEHFRIFKTLEDGPGEYSYPAIIEAKNGDLLLTYSWRRETIRFVRLPLSVVPEN